MTWLNVFVIRTVNTCIFINLIVSLELIMSQSDDSDEYLRSNYISRYLPTRNLHYDIDTIDNKHFGITLHDAGGKVGIGRKRYSRLNDYDQFESLINTEDREEDLHKKYDKPYYFDTQNVNLEEEQTNLESTKDLSDRSEESEKMSAEIDSLEGKQATKKIKINYGYNERDLKQNDEDTVIFSKFYNREVLPKNYQETDWLENNNDYNDDIPSLNTHSTKYSDNSDKNDEEKDSSIVLMMNLKYLQNFLNKAKVQTDLPSKTVKNLQITLEPLLQFEEQNHFEDNEKYDMRHEAYNKVYTKSDKLNRADIKNKERSDKIYARYTKVQSKLKDINWLDILDKNIPAESSDSESQEPLTYSRSDEEKSGIPEKLLKYDNGYKNERAPNKTDVLHKFNFVDTIPITSPDPNDRNSVTLLNDINHLLKQTPISRNAQRESFPKLMDILKEAYTLSTKVKNYITEANRMKNNFDGKNEQNSRELFKYFVFNPPRKYQDISVEELAALLIQDIAYYYLKKIYSPSTRHEIIKKLGVLHFKIKAVKKELMESLEQSIRKRKEMSDNLKNNMRLQEHFRKHWSDSVNDLFRDVPDENTVRRQSFFDFLQGIDPSPTRTKDNPATYDEICKDEDEGKLTPNKNKELIEEKERDFRAEETLPQVQDVNPYDPNENKTNANSSEVNPTETTGNPNENGTNPNVNNDNPDKDGINPNVSEVKSNDPKKEDDIKNEKEINDRDGYNRDDVPNQETTNAEQSSTTQKITTVRPTKKYRFPSYGLFDYWLYKKGIVEDECPGSSVKFGNKCIRLPPH